MCPETSRMEWALVRAQPRHARGPSSTGSGAGNATALKVPGRQQRQALEHYGSLRWNPGYYHFCCGTANSKPHLEQTQVQKQPNLVYLESIPRQSEDVKNTWVIWWFHKNLIILFSWIKLFSLKGQMVILGTAGFEHLGQLLLPL